MEFKPNEITQDAARAIVLKFKEHNKGVPIGSKYLSNVRDWDTVSAKWSDLMDSSRYSLKSIIEKMKEIYATIRNMPDDELLGDTTVHYAFRTERGKRVTIKYTDEYLFLREALRERKESAEYLRKKAQLEEAKEYINANKPQDAKLKEAQAIFDKLSAELSDEDSDMTAPATATTTTATAAQ